MADERQDADRRNRDLERSTEAHWRAAEAGAEEADEPTQTTREGLEIPVAKREDVFEVFERAAKGGSDSGSQPPEK